MRKDFWTFCAERENIRDRKEHSVPSPLTDDPRLAKYWFPNIRRMDDPTTCWLHAAVLRHLSDPQHIVMAVATFRLFNRLDLGPHLQDLLLTFGYDRDLLLTNMGPVRPPLFNGHLPRACTGSSLAATVAILDNLQAADNVRAQLVGTSLQQATEALSEVKGLRGLAYEIVLDLRHTPALADAPDVLSWSAETPAAVSGLGEYLERKLWSTRAADRATYRHWSNRLLAEQNPLAKGWEMAEIHRALCLYFTWARKAQPTRRYRK